MKNFTYISVLIMILSIFSLCGEHVPHELRIGIATFPGNLNPVYITDEASQAVANKVFRSLFSFDHKGDLQKDLVQEYSFSGDGKTLLLKLKQGVYFSNGSQCTARDVVETFKLLRDERFKYPYASTLNFLASVKIRDRFSLALEFKEPYAPWRNYFTFFILQADELLQASPKNLKQQSLSGCGYYRISKVSKPTGLTLELNRPRNHPTMYRYIKYRVVPYSRLTPLKLANSEIDLCEIQPGHVDAYRGSESWRKAFSILKYKKSGYTYLVFNLKKTGVTLAARKHFYNVLVQGDFLDRFLRKRGERVKSPFLLLAKGVTTRAFSVQPLEKKLTLRLLVNSESKFRRELAMFMKEELKPLGIILEPVFMEYHSFLKSLKESRFQVALSGFMLDMDYDMKDIFHSRAHFNYAGYGSSRMDSLMERGLQEVNSQKRAAIYRQAHDLWLEDLPLLPLFNLYYYVGVSRDIPVPERVYSMVGSSGDYLFNIHEWHMR